MGERIDVIRLEKVLPRVFASESISTSEVWLTDVTFIRGSHYLIEAASGAGKSSLCSYIYGARTDFEGILYFNDRDVSKLSLAEWQRLRRENIAYLPQDLMLFPELSTMANIELKNKLTNEFSKERIEEWLHEVGIDSRKYFPVGKMSIGQQQRVGIIRSLCQPFDFILLDEPVSHLDEVNNRIAAKLIADIASSRGAGIISTSVGNPLLLDNALTVRL